MAFNFGFSAMSAKAVDSTLEICVSAASHTIDHLIAGHVAGGDLRTEVERNQTPTLRCCIHIGAHLHEPDPCVYFPGVGPVRQRPFLGTVVMAMPLRESRVYVYKGWEKCAQGHITRTRPDCYRSRQQSVVRIFRAHLHRSEERRVGKGCRSGD